MIRMDVLAVRLDREAGQAAQRGVKAVYVHAFLEAEGTAVVLLQEAADESRILPIYIGAPEAAAIAMELQGQQPVRPMTHDLFRDVITVLGARLERVEITELRDKTFFAELEVHTDGGVERISSRPSDGIALAVRTQATIYAAEAVLDEAAAVVVEHDEVEAEMNAFREFLDDVNPGDFGSQ